MHLSTDLLLTLIAIFSVVVWILISRIVAGQKPPVGASDYEARI